MTNGCEHEHRCAKLWNFPSRQNFIDDPRLRDACDSFIEPVPWIGEFLMVEPEEVENGGMPVLDTYRFVGNRESKFVR